MVQATTSSMGRKKPRVQHCSRTVDTLPKGGAGPAMAASFWCAHSGCSSTSKSSGSTQTLVGWPTHGVRAEIQADPSGNSEVVLKSESSPCGCAIHRLTCCRWLYKLGACRTSEQFTGYPMARVGVVIWAGCRLFWHIYVEMEPGSGLTQ